jgi:hypothetical protein
MAITRVELVGREGSHESAAQRNTDSACAAVLGTLSGLGDKLQQFGSGKSLRLRAATQSPGEAPASSPAGKSAVGERATLEAVMSRR